MQHLLPVYNPDKTKCAHKTCDLYTSRVWGFCDIPNGRLYFGRGEDHNKCREPFYRTLKQFNPICKHMTLQDIAKWADENALLKSSVSKNIDYFSAASFTTTTTTTFSSQSSQSSDIFNLSNNNKKQKIDNHNISFLIKQIHYCTIHGINQQSLNYIYFLINNNIHNTIHNTLIDNNQKIEIITDYYNWNRHFLQPKPNYITYDTIVFYNDDQAAEVLFNLSKN